MIKRGSAQAISFIFNPVFATAAILLLSLAATPTDQKRTWVNIIVISNLFIPILLASALMKRGFALDDTLENRRVKRERLYIIGPLVIIGLWQWYLASTDQIGQPLTANIVATTLLTAVMATISYVWKISHHLTNISALAVISSLVYGQAAIALILLIPLVAWARLSLNRHTIKQLIGGTLLAPIVILGVFYFYDLL